MSGRVPQEFLNDTVVSSFHLGKKSNICFIWGTGGTENKPDITNNVSVHWSFDEQNSGHNYV